MALERASRISVTNSAGFDLKFRVGWNGNQNNDWSSSYPNPQIQSLDLTTVGGLASGDEVTLTVHADGGRTHNTSGDDNIIFDSSSTNTVNYTVTGTTLIFTIHKTN